MFPCSMNRTHDYLTAWLTYTGYNPKVRRGRSRQSRIKAPIFMLIILMSLTDGMVQPPQTSDQMRNLAYAYNLAWDSIFLIHCRHLPYWNFHVGAYWNGKNDHWMDLSYLRRKKLNWLTGLIPSYETSKASLSSPYWICPLNIDLTSSPWPWATLYREKICWLAHVVLDRYLTSFSFQDRKFPRKLLTFMVRYWLSSVRTYRSLHWNFDWFCHRTNPVPSGSIDSLFTFPIWPTPPSAKFPF